MKTDKRKSVRRPLDCTAWIARQDKPLEVCALADISDKGARLEVMDIDTIPDEFVLFLSPHGTPRRRCRVAWRSKNQIGVRFEASPLPQKGARAKAMMAAREASLQPDMSASQDAPGAAETSDGEKESA
jgi:hypothetical protein